MFEKDILDKPITVLGAGTCGQAMAADVFLAGEKVHPYELPEFKRCYNSRLGKRPAATGFFI